MHVERSRRYRAKQRVTDQGLLPAGKNARLGECLAFAPPGFSVVAIVGIENGLREGAPTHIANETLPFAVRGCPLFFVKALEDANGRDIGGNLGLCCPLADLVSVGDLVIEACPVAAPVGLIVQM